ncbi:CinA family protein [Tritonibacter mobilis]|uniref:Damage-inducible protein CinA n=1 Tax=Tritonibacter mobilis F1926 TaxID=1265309 RepID=A0A1B1A1U1_9RHOB|nr:CinA family protein [Tritonibacter mobilis]ANP40458.1 damage-inducible protein CinA [Tritonibacter mobilis F1926]KJZ25187.1 damage-inducible protein CinA [Tritonibacter mobilis]
MNINTLLDLAKAQGATLTTAESCTGGMIAAALTDIPGSSAVVDRGFVTYSNAAKMQMLGVSAQTLKDFGAVSEETAREMAEGALRAAGTTFAVSVTGIAGPGGSEHKPEGRVCFGLAQSGAETVTELVDFGALGRDKVRLASRDHALAMLLRALERHTA